MTFCGVGWASHGRIVPTTPIRSHLVVGHPSSSAENQATSSTISFAKLISLLITVRLSLVAGSPIDRYTRLQPLLSLHHHRHSLVLHVLITPRMITLNVYDVCPRSAPAECERPLPDREGLYPAP
jgi:hypothetical protein